MATEHKNHKKRKKREKKDIVQCGNANLVGFGEEARGQQRVFGRFQAVGGALRHNNVHGHVAHSVQFLHPEEPTHPLHHVLHLTCRCAAGRWCFTNLISFGVIDRLGIFRLFDVFHHFPDQGVAVVLVLGHDDLKDEPQSSDNGGRRQGQKLELEQHFFLSLLIPQQVPINPVAE